METNHDLSKSWNLKGKKSRVLVFLEPFQEQHKKARPSGNKPYFVSTFSSTKPELPSPSPTMATRIRPSDFSVEVTRLEGEPVANSPHVNSIEIEFKMIQQVRNDSRVIVYRDELIRDSWSEARALFPVSVFSTEKYIADYLVQAGLTQSEATRFVGTDVLPPLNQGENQRCSRLSMVVTKNVTLAESVR